jgi:hypothetical protein
VRSYLEQDAIQVNLTSILNNAKVLVDRTKSNTVSNTFSLQNSNNTTLSLYPNPLKITASDNSTLFQVDTNGNLAAKNAVSAASYYLSNNGNPIDVGTKVNDAANSLISLGGKIDKIVECVGSMVTILKNMGMIVTATAVLDGVLQITSFAQQEVQLLTNSHSLTSTPQFYQLTLGSLVHVGSNGLTHAQVRR